MNERGEIYIQMWINNTILTTDKIGLRLYACKRYRKYKNIK